MLQRSRSHFSMKAGVLGFAVFFLLALVFMSCNSVTSPGTSTPSAPHISYKSSAVVGIKDSIVVPDTVVSDSGVVTSYSISPTLPAGLKLDTATGLISGKPTVLYPLTKHTVTATGPGGSATATVYICVGDDDNVCNTGVPIISYFDGTPEYPGFFWTSPNVAIPSNADTIVSTGGVITSYSVSPALPSWVSLNSTTGVISGTPTDTMTPKVFELTATGPFGTDRINVYIGVYPSSYPFGLLAKGRNIFRIVCSDCHGADGEGRRCPQLRPSDYLMADKHRPIRIQFVGLPNFVDTSKTIKVNGIPWSSSMSSQLDNFPEGGNDTEIAGVLTFVRAFLNGAKDSVTVSEVGHVRDSLISVNPDTNQYYINPQH